MVIDACTTSECLASFWLQWEDASSLNFKRATFSFTASAICDKKVGSKRDIYDTMQVRHGVMLVGLTLTG